MYLIMVCGVFVWCDSCVSVCILTVSNALPMLSATVIVRSGGLIWLKPVVMVLFMLRSAVLVEWLLLKPWCVEMLFVMYGSSVSSIITRHHHGVLTHFTTGHRGQLNTHYHQTTYP